MLFYQLSKLKKDKRNFLMSSIIDKYKILLTELKKYITDQKDIFLENDSEYEFFINKCLTTNKQPSVIENKDPIPFIPKKTLPSSPIQKEPEIIPIKQTQPTEKIAKVEKIKDIEDNFSDIKMLLKDSFSNIQVKEKPLDDAIAKQVSQKYKLETQTAPITFLSSKEDEKTYKFIQQISRAINVCIIPTKIIQSKSFEEENKWSSFLNTSSIKLIIACDYSLWALPNLMKHYKEIPRKSQCFLGTIPLFLLPDLSLYIKNPLLKPSLWEALQNKISLIHGKYD
jgi:hypothetical protein